MKIGNTELTGYAALAPMAGITDAAFREVCLSYGASFAVSEMVSSKGLTMNDRKSGALMTPAKDEKLPVIQIFGCVPETMAEAAKAAEQAGSTWIDINMGCPAPKVSGNGGGSALMKNPELAAEIVSACVNAVKVPITCKIRSGWDDNSLNAVEMAVLLEKAGASAIAVHGRTKKQMYAPPVNYDIIRDVKSAVKIPVIGNGDVTDIKTAKYMYDYTKCDFVLIGRGALGSPWVFEQINSYFESGKEISIPPVEKRMKIMINHIKALCELKGDYVGMREARKHAGWYVKGIRGAAAFRRDIGALESLDQLKDLAERVVASASEEDNI